MHRSVAGLIAFTTSAATLVMEIVASRLLAPYVGVTLQTYTAIIGVVLAGISLGSWLGGRLADRADPIRLVVLVLVGGGALVFASLFLLRLGAQVFTGSGPASAVGLVAVAFLAPATVLSMETPLLIKASLTDLSRTGREVGRISALGTAGAIVGTFAAGFLLVATISSPMILAIIGVVLVLMGVGVWATYRTQLKPGRWAKLPAVALVIAGGAGGTVPLHTTPCQVETAYFCATVIEDSDQVRILQLDTLLHSAVDLSDDRNLIFEYTASIGAAIDVQWSGVKPISAMHVGGGGFTIPRYVRATKPGSTNLVIERDPELVKLDQRELGLVLGDGLTAQSIDGRIAVKRAAKQSLDLLVGDAFGGEAVPWHLATREFTRLIAASLRTDGLYALNVIDGAPAKFAKAEAATIRDAFPYVAVTAPVAAFTGDSGANYIMLASKSPLPLDRLAARHREVGLRLRILSGPELTAWIGNARVLTDAFAPVDQLLTVGG